MQNKNLTRRNNLLQARRRSGLDPKQIVFLLSKESKDQLYRYESGFYFPTLPTALKLEIIYRTPVRLLYQDLYESLKTEITERCKSGARLFPEEEPLPSWGEQLGREEQCFFADIMKSRFPSRTEMEMIRKHIIALSNTLVDYKQGRNPFFLEAKR